MATQEERLKTIAGNLQATYEAMRRAAANISGLLQVGRATCEEVKAYNLWALAIYNTQRGMLATLRANGQPDVPELPPSPTLFPLRGKQGTEAWMIDCGNSSSLAGAMKSALRGPSSKTIYLSSNEVAIATQDPNVFNPGAAPTFAQLSQMQDQQLGAAIAVIILIGVIVVAVSVGLAAIMHYLEVSEVQESNTRQTQLQADAFAKYTEARLSCYAQCTQSGKSTEECVSICAKLVDKPDIKLPGSSKPWGMLQWIGFTVVAGVGTMVAVKLWQRKQSGRPFFELPESVQHAISPHE